MLLPYAYQQYFVSVPYRRINEAQDPAALAKLYYLLSRGESPEAVKRDMQRDLRGEMTVRA